MTYTENLVKFGHIVRLICYGRGLTDTITTNRYTDMLTKFSALLTAENVDFIQHTLVPLRMCLYGLYSKFYCLRVQLDGRDAARRADQSAATEIC